MSEQEIDSEWEQISESRVGLNPDVKIYLRHYRKQVWYLLINTLTRQQVLVDGSAHFFLSVLQKGNKVGEALAALTARGDEMTREDVVILVSHLARLDMLSGDVSRSAEEKVHDHKMMERAQKLRKFATPFSIRIPLFDPHKLLVGLTLPGKLVFSGFGAVLLTLLLVSGLVVFAQNIVAIGVHWSARFPDPENLLWSLLLYPLIKAFHELGHGMAARRFGADIREMGVMLLIFVPVPYVDATPTAMFHSSRQRMLVAAAGILVELALAAMAIILWSTLEQGFLKDMCFNIAVIGGISTLLFNGNPLLRFDGYYVLSDLLEIPNLGSRSSAFLGYLYKTRVLGLDTHRPMTESGETSWLIGYGLASGFYRLVLSFTIAIYVAGKFFILGVLLALWFLLYSLILPFLRGLWRTFLAALSQNRLVRFTVVSMFLFLLFPILLFTVPMPYSTIAYGMVIPPERSIVRAGTTGFIRETHVNDGEEVGSGTTLIELRNFEFLQEERALVARLEQLNAEYRAALNIDPSESRRLAQLIEISENKHQDMLLEIRDLTIVSPANGYFSLAGNRAVTGGYLKKGDIVGFVTKPGEREVRVMVSQNSIDAVRRQTIEMAAISLSQPRLVLEVDASSERPMATTRLPDAALGSSFGGPIPVDARDPEGLRLLRPMFQLDVILPDSANYIGETFVVKFLHYNQPIGIRLYRAIRSHMASELSLDV